MPTTIEIKPYLPTKKWWAALASGLSLVVAHAIVSGGWDTTEDGELGALAAALVGAYFKRNDKTVEGKIPA